MLQRLVTRSARGVVRPSSMAVRGFAVKAEQSGAEDAAMRPIHFVQDEQDAAARPFRVVGIRDVEVQDWEYPTRIEADQKAKPRVLRNRFQHPNFISLWVDDLVKVESYLKQEQIPLGASEGIVAGPEGHNVLVIPPTEDGRSVEFFDLCGNPAMVELVQATPEVIKEFEDDEATE